MFRHRVWGVGFACCGRCGACMCRGDERGGSRALGGEFGAFLSRGLCFGFGVWGLGIWFGVWGSGFRYMVWGLGVWVQVHFLSRRLGIVHLTSYTLHPEL